MNENKPTILIVDDEPSVRESISIILQNDYQIIAVPDGLAAIQAAYQEKIDLVLLDIRMPGLDGIETLLKLKKIAPNIEVIMLTAVSDAQKATFSIRHGARDYIVKPFDIQKIRNVIRETIDRRDINKSLDPRYQHQLIGKSEKIKSLRNQIREISQSKDWVVIIAEDGCEKDEVAQMIHILGWGSMGEFLEVDAAGLLRVFEDPQMAQGVKTLFIDRIEELDHSIQAKLQSLEEGIRLVLGSSSDIKNLRIIPALFKRIQANQIRIPPLRERIIDLPYILSYCQETFSQIYQKKIGFFTSDALELLSVYPWPGNLEELKSLVSTVILNKKSESQIEVSDLPLNVLIEESSAIPQYFEDLYSRFEKKLIHAVLDKTDSNKEEAARLLGIKPIVLDAKLE